MYIDHTNFFRQDLPCTISKPIVDLENLNRFSKSTMFLQHGMLTNASHAYYITSMMAYVSSSVYSFLGRMAYVPSSAYNVFGRMTYVSSSAYNVFGRMAYVPSSAYKNHVLANALHVPNIQKISNTGTDTDTDINTLSNSNTHSLSFNIIYTPKIEIISHYKRSYPKAIVPYWFEISELMSYETL